MTFRLLFKIKKNSWCDSLSRHSQSFQRAAARLASCSLLGGETSGVLSYGKIKEANECVVLLEFDRLVFLADIIGSEFCLCTSNETTGAPIISQTPFHKKDTRGKISIPSSESLKDVCALVGLGKGYGSARFLVSVRSCQSLRLNTEEASCCSRQCLCGWYDSKVMP